jgi:hypothetical protein
LNIGSEGGLTIINRPSPHLTRDSQVDGSVAYITSDYNTGYMTGDIKGAWLSDTDDTNVTSANLMSGATYASTARLSSYSYTNGSSTLVMDDDEASVDGYVQLTLGGLSASTTYVISFTADETYPNNVTYMNHVGNTTDGTVYEDSTQVGISLHRNITFTTATSGDPTVVVYTGYDGGDITYTLDLRLADADRSVNDNGLQVVGTVDKDAVATGADLVAYSGFSASNYLEQPYNSDLDFGTGDFSVMGWFKTSATTAEQMFLDRSTGSANIFRARMMSTTSKAQFAVKDNTTWAYTYSSSALDNDTWHYLVGTKIGETASLYIDGVFQDSTGGLTTTISSSTSATLDIGHEGGTNPADDSSLALWRISATAPSAEQIAKIYNDEKYLFATNAKATLYGSSDAVTALGYDEDTELLHVGTSAGRSEFQGLNRVNNTTDAVGTAISASNGLVAED